MTVFDIRDIPFSHRGSWFGISPVIAENTYADDLHLVSHQTGMHPILRFAASAAPDLTVVATPAKLAWRSPAGAIELVYQTPDTIRLRSDGGLGMRIAAAATTLTPFSGTYLYRDPASGALVFTSYETGRRYRLTVLHGSPLAVEGVEMLGAGDRFAEFPAGVPWEIAIEEYETARPPFGRPEHAFNDVVTAAQAAFDAFADAIAPWRTAATPAAGLAAYVLWSATVAAGGFVTRPAVLMSKHWMDKVWSWDHCFNAIALAAGEPGLALDQFLLPFDHQDPAGALPDSITHSEVLYNFVKPPIHGWAFGLLRRRLGEPLDPARLIEAYDLMSRWARFWLDHRRPPGDPLPYYQHGNDSGWDNATTFDPGRVLQTADLAALLTLHLRELSALETELGLDHSWDEVAAEVEKDLLDRLWDGERFVARRPGDGATFPSGSLLALMPIALGEALPAEVRDRLVAGLRRHLTGNGLATEPVDSPDYAADGYWRGPIWAPSTVLVEDGLRRAGETALADEVSERFRALCERSGFAENFDAVTGRGLRDRAYTWTAACYLILAEAYEGRRRAAG
ncbi:glycogen debranching protein [Actinoplanes sp. NPDC023714]|uniref:amylo-alpha-1,6-glucosidase n=1 Tax=Actinoplanes sp. NPDC023714 TaxID=3154322 RepID=UPI0033DF9349